jgi:hypothetical protein
MHISATHYDSRAEKHHDPPIRINIARMMQVAEDKPGGMIARCVRRPVSRKYPEIHNEAPSYIGNLDIN